MSEWFIARRGLANGILFAGMFPITSHIGLSLIMNLGNSSGGVLLPLVLPPLISTYGAPKTLRILAIAIAVLIFPLLPFVEGRLPEVREHVHGPAPRGAAGPHDWMKHKSFWIFLAVNTLQGFAYFVPVVYLPSKPVRFSFRTGHSVTVAFANELNISSYDSAVTLATVNGEPSNGLSNFSSYLNTISCIGNWPSGDGISI
jgi:MCP family monocarboxylic acid transporter-like MFS transporter 10